MTSPDWDTWTGDVTKLHPLARLCRRIESQSNADQMRHCDCVYVDIEMGSAELKRIDLNDPSTAYTLWMERRLCRCPMCSCARLSRTVTPTAHTSAAIFLFWIFIYCLSWFIIYYLFFIIFYFLFFIFYFLFILIFNLLFIVYYLLFFIYFLFIAYYLLFII